MPLKHRIDAQLLSSRYRQQGIHGFIGPIERDGGGVGDKEVVEGDRGIDLDHFVAHAWPREVVDPGGVRGEELGWAGGHPGRKAGVGFFCGRNLPAHYEEHYIPVRVSIEALITRF